MFNYQNRAIIELNYLEKEINSLRNNNERLIDEIEDIKAMASRRVSFFYLKKFQNEQSHIDKQTHTLMENEFNQLLKDEEELKLKEQSVMDNYNKNIEVYEQEKFNLET